ncbi:GlxA family transcriptional regulator [Yinghuangia aomiensis]|uniref:GlxA family transcriptional regulator n=1 Tax=Yinghuangia aomiensis TaxID=676205 RepID=A0ABP9HC32_9ACTN
MDLVRVGVLAYPECFASEVFGVPDLLTMAGHVASGYGDARRSYEVHVVSPRRRVAASGGAALDVAAMRPVDVLVVPGFAWAPGLDIGAFLGGLAPEIAGIRAQAESGGAVAAICVGAFLVAEAGLLAGRGATTSWLFADRLARRYPDVRVRADELVVTDGGVTTTGAFSAMYDFALGLVGTYAGPRVARGTARVALLDDARSRQTPYVDTALLPPAGGDFAHEVRRWLDRRLADRYDLPALAAAFHVSTRTMLRRFGAETGGTPLTYLHTARVRRARQLLETTDRTVAAIAAEVGYRTPGSFGQVFARHTGRGPGEYRARFRRGGGPG